MNRKTGSPVRRRQRVRDGFFVLALAIVLCLADRAIADPSDLCLTAARQAAADTGVPLSVLIAITQTETGRRQNGQSRPWPWTVNMEGAGHWFDSRQTAQDFAAAAHANGARSFDIGCFQINYRWHGEHFASLDQMFDPSINAAYAARFLAQLFAEKGDWSVAAGAFHSRSEEYANRYRQAFDRHRTDAVAAGADSGAEGTLLLAAQETTATARINNFPLLQARSGQRSLGSLVTLDTANGG